MAGKDSRKTYIITGGCGFVGANLAAELVRREPTAYIHVVDSFRSGSCSNLVDSFARRGLGGFGGWVTAESICDVNLAALVDVAQPAAVFHMGAITDTTVYDEREMLRENAEPFPELLDACIESRTPLVYASSAAVYGAPAAADERRPFREDEAGRPINVYGFSKWLMEAEHRRAAEERGADRVVGLRFFNVFGPGEGAKGKMASVARQLAAQMLAGKRPRIFTAGEQARDQVPIDDVVDCCIASAKPTARGGIYNLGSGSATTFNDLLAAVRRGVDITETQLPTEYFDMPADLGGKYQSYTCADMSLARDGLGWSPTRDPLAEAERYAAMLRSGEPA